MFPFRHSSIFRSRWIALLWAGGILWTAVDFASPETANQAGKSSLAVDPEQAQQAPKLLESIGN